MATGQLTEGAPPEIRLEAPADGEANNVLGVVHPKSAEEVSAVVAWARRTRAALTPRSSRMPHGEASAPAVPSVVVDLSESRRVIRCDRRNRVALFEAGVTFPDLVRDLAVVGLRPVVPLGPRPGKSALAAYLDREPTVYPRAQWDLADPLLCLEVVFGTGDVFRTGSAAGPGSLEDQWAAGDAQKGPMGPGHADWMRIVQGSQGTVGIATWGSAKTEVEPERETVLLAGARDLAALTHATYRLLRKGVVDACFLLDAGALEDVLGERPAGAGEWNLVVSVSGHEPLAVRRHDRSLTLTRATLDAVGATCVEGPDAAYRVVQAIPSGPHWRDRRRGAHRRVFFQTTLDRAGGFVASLRRLAQDAGTDTDGLGFYVQPQLGGRCCHVELVVACTPDSAEEEATAAFTEQVAAPLIAEGAFFSRPYGAWTEAAFAAAPGSRAALHRVKSIFDPDAVLSPGRLGLGRPTEGAL